MNAPLPPASVRAKVLESARRDPAPPRSQGLQRRRWALGLGFAAAAAIAIGVGPHAGARPPAYIGALATTWLVVALAATWAALDRGGSMLGRSSLWKGVAAAMVPAALLATWLAAAQLWPETTRDPSATAPTSQTVRCILMTFLLAAGPLAAFVWTRKRSDPVSPGLSGATLGAAAAAWAAFALIVLCDFADAAHIVLGHLLPAACTVFAGTLLGVRIVALRAPRR